MAGFEVVVRPAVFPNIRPQPARSLAPEDSPEFGVISLTGPNGQLVTLTTSIQASWSQTQAAAETKRKVIKIRKYYTRPDGTIDYTRWIEYEVVKNLSFLEAWKTVRRKYAPVETSGPDTQVMQDNVTKKNPETPSRT